MTHSLKATASLRALTACLAAAVLLSAPALAEDAETENPHAFGIPEITDPVVRESIITLRETGVVEAQGRIGSELLMIERLQRRADALRSLMERLGTEGVRQLDPELYEQISTSPIFLQQRIAEITLQRELDEALNPPAPEEDVSEVDDGPAVRDDGSDFFQPSFAGPSGQPGFGRPMDDLSMGFDRPDSFMPVDSGFPDSFGEPEGFGSDSLSTEDFGSDYLAPEDTETAMPEPEPAVDRISLREIYGAPGNLRAVVQVNGDTYQVFSGDRLSETSEVISIGESSILVRIGEEEQELFLRN